MNKSEFLKLSYQEQKTALEVIIFASDTPLSISDFNTIFNINRVSSKINNNSNKLDNTNLEEEIDNQIINEGNICDSVENEDEIFDFEKLINEINIDLNSTGRPFQIIQNAGGYLFSTKAEYGEILQNISKYRVKKRLSQAALETLSIIAYKQPISKPEIEQIRGVNSNEIVNNLTERGLIEISGRRDIIGKPLLYSTTQNFLLVFGINSIDELPKLREIDEILEDHNQSIDNTITLNIEGFDENADNSKLDISTLSDIEDSENDNSINNLENNENIKSEEIINE